MVKEVPHGGQSDVVWPRETGKECPQLLYAHTYLVYAVLQVRLVSVFVVAEAMSVAEL